MASGIAKFVPAITDAYGIAEKQVRYAKIGELKKQCVAELTAREGNTWTPAQIEAEFHDAEKNVVRSRIIAGKPRIDGRDTKTVRKIDVQVGILPRTHGSADLHAWRDPSAGRDDAWHRPRRADHRRARRRAERPVHAPLQLPAV